MTIINEEEEKKRAMLLEKFRFLEDSRIRISPNGIWVSDNGPQELERVKEILSDEEVYQAVVEEKFGRYRLAGWLRHFDKNIVNKPENVKRLALYNPTYFGMLSTEVKNDVNIMRECASQQGIQPILMCYTGENVRDDFEFIAGLIINSDETTFDFVRWGGLNLEGSEMAYGKTIGATVLSNPAFWHLLNAKIDSLNTNSSTHIHKFSTEKELELVNNTFMLNESSNESTIEAPTHRRI